jgi:methanesulfonate monooxygenase small subunit
MIDKNLDQVVISLVCRLSAALDTNDISEIEACCAKDFHYKIITYIPDIGKESTWFDQPLVGLLDLLKNLDRHLTMRGSFLRHVSQCIIDRTVDNSEIIVKSSVIVTHTPLDGTSHLYAAGRYTDRITCDKEIPRISDRVVHLQTRDLGPGPHLPI